MTETKRKPRAVKPKYTLICDEKDWLISSKFKFEWLDKIEIQLDPLSLTLAHAVQPPLWIDIQYS